MDPVTRRNGQISHVTCRTSEIVPRRRKISLHPGIVRRPVYFTVRRADFPIGGRTGLRAGIVRDILQQKGVTVRHPLIGKAERECSLSQIGPWCVEEGLAAQADGGQNQGKR